ncbi:DUF7739 domain-containing protein [Streptomyces niveus]|uniref:DUF7739 domain-containing protein n=1 Tax=Streptomyces niveus TaxID=193462 RepID=UPI00344703D9
MGIVISHADGASRSALTIENLGKHLAHALPARDWRQIRDLFDGTFDDTASIPPKKAGQIAAILRTASNSRRMPGEWDGLARLIADAADRAHRAGQPWRWS